MCVVKECTAWTGYTNRKCCQQFSISNLFVEHQQFQWQGNCHSTVRNVFFSTASAIFKND